MTTTSTEDLFPRLDADVPLGLDSSGSMSSGSASPTSSSGGSSGSSTSGDQRRGEAADRAGQRRRSLAAHPSAGRQKLQILVQIDAEGRSIRIVVGGCLTPLNIHCLDLVISRARTLGRDSDIIVDVSRAGRWDGMDAWLRPDAIEHRIHRDATGSDACHRLRVVPA